VWAGKESHLSLVGEAFTRIRPRVQPRPFVDLVGKVMYGLDTVFHFATNRTVFHCGIDVDNGTHRVDLQLIKSRVLSLAFACSWGFLKLYL